MNNGQIVTCASCSKYPLREAAENNGRALCPDFEQPRAYDYRPCPLHVTAKDGSYRRDLVEKMKEQRKNEGIE